MAFIKNINAWKGKSQKAKDKIRGKATLYVRNKVRIVYREVLKVSPQWSGNYAYNWQILYSRDRSGSYDRRFKQVDWYRQTPKQAGDPEAINAAMRFAEDQIANIPWNSNIALKNYAPIADDIEEGKVKLRPENFIPGGQGVGAYLKQKFNFIT